LAIERGFPSHFMTQHRREKFNWMDVLGLVFLAALAVLPPVNEWHKQAILAGIAIFQLFEGSLIAYLPGRGQAYVVFLKILLATWLLDHTGQLGINSSYYPIYYLPVVTAAIYFGPWGTLAWTALSAAAYCSYLYPALQEYELSEVAVTELAIRILFFFLAAIVVNRFAVENRRQTRQYQTLAEELARTNTRLELAQADARRSERLAALGQLSAGLAHEIRNPLGVIKGSAEILHQKLGEANPLASELAGYISTEVNRLSALVTRFLDFARPLHLELRPANVVAVVERALKSVAAQSNASGVQFVRGFDAPLPAVGLVNLAQKACDAMNGNGTLRVSAARTTRNGAAGVEVRFADTGPGVPDELREQIFNPFMTTKKTGVGLGLSIVSKIVDEHRGFLHFENQPSGGACFSVFFPAMENVSAEGSARASQPVVVPK